VPITLLPFPVAAWVWLLTNLALLFWVTSHLGRLAGLRESWQKGLLFAIVVSFGPVMLNLTLGQISVLLLFFAVMAGRAVKGSTQMGIGIGLGIAGATVAKLYPLIWFGVLLAMGRWQAILVGIALVGSSFALIGLFNPNLLRNWILSVQERLLSVNQAPSVDD